MEKICYNGKYIAKSNFFLSSNNRGFKYGDAFFETIRCFLGKPLFFEEHYFRMASSFVIMKMDVPLNFDMDVFQKLIQDLLIENKLDQQSARVRITFFREDGGYYLPTKKSVNFIIDSEPLDDSKYYLNANGLKMGIYKDNYIESNSLSQLKSTNRLLNIVAAIYSKENNYDDVLLMNNSRNIVEATSGNLFAVHDQIIFTPPIQDGCIDGVIRRVLCANKQFSIQEKSLSYLDIVNAQEVFITNVISGAKWVGKINNSNYGQQKTIEIVNFLNSHLLV
ncbi:MAG: aminotransferase class IV [Flavobacteriales bacterium]|nr:aminotransferase class IV [Flavobacteriales bacterium]